MADDEQGTSTSLRRVDTLSGKEVSLDGSIAPDIGPSEVDRFMRDSFARVATVWSSLAINSS